MARVSNSPIRGGPSRVAGELGATAAAWSDASLVDSMRRGDHAALRAFVNRFGPLLEAHARKTRIPKWEWGSCVTELLNDEAMRIASSTTSPPANLSAYLMRAVTNRHLYVKRSGSSRDRRYRGAAEDIRGETIVPSSCSEFSLRAATGPHAPALACSAVLQELVIALRRGLSIEDDTILSWLADGAPNRLIAEWLGITQAAAAKRTWRLRQRLREKAVEWATAGDAEHRKQFERFLQRAGCRNELRAPRMSPGAHSREFRKY